MTLQYNPTPTKSEVLAHYAREGCEVQELEQVDGWIQREYDSEFHPDTDGDVICGGRTHELHDTKFSVRVFVSLKNKDYETVRLLRKIADVIESRYVR